MVTHSYSSPPWGSFALGLAPRGDNPDPLHLATCDKILRRRTRPASSASSDVADGLQLIRDLDHWPIR